MTGKLIRTVVLLMTLAGMAGCGGVSDRGGATDTLASGSTKCGSYDDGAYKCDYTGGKLIQQCVRGEWLTADRCTCTVRMGDRRKPPYPATCGHDGRGNAFCSFAGTKCMKCDKGDSSCI